jgi:hypothetical protein
MVDDLLVANKVLLLLCTSMYLGTGWSLVLFTFPTAGDLNPGNYALVFNQPVRLATRFFTWMTTVMLVSAALMIAGDWRSPYVVLPAIVLLAAIAATLLTVRVIFPLNAEMDRGITDAARLRVVLSRWMGLNRVRVALWTVQWLCAALALALRQR